MKAKSLKALSGNAKMPRVPRTAMPSMEANAKPKLPSTMAKPKMPTEFAAKQAKPMMSFKRGGKI